MLFGVWVTGIILRQGDGILSVRMEMVFYRSVILPYAYLQSQYCARTMLASFRIPQEEERTFPRLLASFPRSPCAAVGLVAMPAPRRHDHLYSQA